jgi:hypothetical protein
VVALAELPEG